jgi:transposase
MKTRDAIKITVETTTKQSSWLDQVIGSARFARNQLIALTDHYYENTGKFIGSSQLSVLSAHLPYLKKKFEFIKNVPALSLQNIAGDLEDDYRDYIAYLADPKGRKIGKPHFKSKSDKSSITIPINKKDITYNYINQTITFAKFKINNEQQYLNIKLFRNPFDCKPEEIQSFIREITITRLRYKKNKYQISFSFARTAEAQPPYEPVTVSSFCEYKDIKTENFDCDSFRREAY